MPCTNHVRAGATQEVPLNPADTVWLMTCSALVLLMTPGLAFFYGGLVRGRNAVSMIMYSFMAMAVVSLVWVYWGYSVAFGPGNAWFGDLSAVGLRNIGIDDVSGTVPTLLNVAFQMMFAIITPALISGAVAERFKFSTYLVFLVLWVTFVYAPVAHWAWSPSGWLARAGLLDFAGGTVVEINSGVASLVAALVVGPRRYPGTEPHNVPFVVLGGGLLWFGWLGFNAGAGLQANGQAVSALLSTNTAGAAGAVLWALVSQWQNGRISAVGVATGAVAGMVAITPAAGFVDVMGASIIGGVAAALGYGAVLLRPRTGLDDSLDVFGIHGIGGIWGTIATGIFAVKGIGGTPGALEGNWAQVGVQIMGVGATAAYCALATFVLLRLLDVLPGLGVRVPDHEEAQGLDITAHGERAYVQDGAD